MSLEGIHVVGSLSRGFLFRLCHNNNSTICITSLSAINARFDTLQYTSLDFYTLIATCPSITAVKPPEQLPKCPLLPPGIVVSASTSPGTPAVSNLG